MSATRDSRSATARTSALTTERATASLKSYKVCAKSDRATGTLSPSRSAAVTVAEAGGRTVRSVPSQAPWPSRSFALMAEDTRPVEQILMSARLFTTSAAMGSASMRGELTIVFAIWAILPMSLALFALI